MEPDAITSHWLSEVLDRDVALVDTQRVGDGLVGMNLRLTLRHDAPDLPATMVMKLPSPDPTSRATGIALRNYEREVKFYDQIAPTVDIRVARCFDGAWNEADGDFHLLLEDLAPAEQGNQVTGCDEHRARRAVLELARLHGPRWADPALDDIEFLTRRTPDDAQQLMALWQMMLPNFLGTYAKYFDAEGLALIERFGDRLPAWQDGHTLQPTVTHGDYRLDNLMFATAAGGYPVAAVDWQTPGHGPASVDVAYFLSAGPLPPDRARIERAVVDDYLAALDGYGVAVDTGEFWTQYRRDAYAGLIMAVIASQIVGGSERSEAMFAAMATRAVCQALDLGSESLI